MAKIVDYKLASGTLARHPNLPRGKTIEEAVKELLAEGWQPFGSGFSSTLSGMPMGNLGSAIPEIAIFHQPMVKTEEPA